MKWFNFGDKFVDMIKILFNEISMCTINNGFTLTSFIATRGLYQGNPITSTCFLLIIERLAIRLRNNKRIKGIRVKDEEIMLSLFADDLGLLLQFDKSVWEEAMYELSEFEKESGTKINYNKTTVYRIGSLVNSNAAFYTTKKLQWTNEPIKILGVTITANKNDIFKLNIDPIITKMQQILKLWCNRGLSLFGKINVINTLTASLFVHKLAVLPSLPENYINKIHKVWSEFIWNEKKPKIRIKILQANKDDSGAGLVDI